MSLSEKITIQIHPRAFSAFGEDLVTSDFVAVTELVKNSYDAFALKVNIVFSVDDDGEPYIQIIDDGCGMIRDTIVNAWATIATPYKKKNPIIVRMIDGKEETRVVSGNKGLGRFSAARLGNQMRMITKHIDGECIEASFDWTSFNSIENIADCYMTLKTISENPFANNSNETGTIIEIRDLNSIWDALKIYQLKDELSRLVSPFEQVNNFDINIITSTTNDLIKITPNDFINNPIYKISGYVDSSGSVIWNYTFNDGDSKRNLSGKIEWNERNYTNYSEFTTYRCGGFSFEIRAWELNADSIAALSGRFNIGKKEIRKNISMYKGISIYRDSVLVLPKSESSRDWLGLDAKRISQIGRRLSTSQIVGIVNITNQNNPQIKDTTDREKIVDSIEYRQLKEVLYVIVDKLQSERLKDKNEEMKRDELSDVIEPLSSKSLLETVQSAVKKGESSESILEYVRDYDQTNEKQLNELNKRLVYYAQTASLGSIAIVIMHEFLTGMTAIKRFLNKTAEYLDSFDKRTQDYLDGSLWQPGLPAADGSSGAYGKMEAGCSGGHSGPVAGTAGERPHQPGRIDRSLRPQPGTGEAAQRGGNPRRHPGPEKGSGLHPEQRVPGSRLRLADLGTSMNEK